MSISNPATVPTGQFEDATAALVLTPPGGDPGVCPRLLVGAADGEMDLLRVAYRDPGRVVEEWPTHLADPPENARLVAAGRAAAAVEASDIDHGVETVPPADLTAVGVRTTELLDRWSTTDRQSVVCLDSVTDVLQHVSFETAFRFLHVFTNQLAAVDAVGHVHLDPTAHDDRTVQRVMELFDAVVEHDDDGVEVRTRR
jgi:hypothetical protein